MNNVINFKEKGLISKKYIRAKDIQAIFSIARSTVDNWAKKGYLIRHKIGRNIFYDVSEIELLQETLWHA